MKTKTFSKILNLCFNLIAFALLVFSSNQSLAQSNIHAQAYKGTLKVAVILVTYDGGVLDCSIDGTKKAIFGNEEGSVNHMLRTLSEGEFGVDGDVFGPVDLVDFDFQNTGDFQEAKTILTNQGVDFTPYSRTIYIYTDQYMPDPTSAGGLNSGSNIYIPSGGCLAKATLSHEILHSIRLDHAFSDGGGVTDQSDVMGYYKYMTGLNAPHLEELGWLENTTNIYQSGVYTISALELTGEEAQHPQALKIYKADTEEVYYLSLRIPVLYSQNLFEEYKNKLNIQRRNYGKSSSVTRKYNPIDVGESFMDDINGINVKVLSKDATSITIDISFSGNSQIPVDIYAPAINPTFPYKDQYFMEGDIIPITFYSKDEDIAYINVKVNGNVICQLTTQPYICNWKAQRGKIQITFETADKSGNTYSPYCCVASPNIYVLSAIDFDKEAPSSPSNLKLTSNMCSNASLSWTGSTDTGGAGLSSYKIYDASTGNPVTTSKGTNVSINTLTPLTFYSYYVTAIDNAGNESVASEILSFTTPECDTLPPQIDILSPTNGSSVEKGLTATIKASISENEAIKVVYTYVNGQLICTNNSDSSLVSCSWEVPKGKSQTFSIEIKAYDSSNNLGTAHITVTSGTNTTDGTGSNGGGGKGKGGKK